MKYIGIAGATVSVARQYQRHAMDMKYIGIVGVTVSVARQYQHHVMDMKYIGIVGATVSVTRQYQHKENNAMRELPSRKTRRLREYDYACNGAYFVTICAKNHAKIFGEIIYETGDGNQQCSPERIVFSKLSAIGKIIETAILQNRRKQFWVDQYIIMPNHIHLIVMLSSQLGERRSTPLQMIIRNMKAYISKCLGFSPWQKSFYDHIIRNYDEYNSIAEYIINNPAKWEDDRFFVANDDFLST